VHFKLPLPATVESLQESFASVAERFSMDARIHDANRKARLLILVSRQGHCLNDLLFRTHSGQLPVEIAAVASNHNDFSTMAAAYDIPVHHLPVTAETKRQQEQQILDLVEEHKVDLAVLAPYMQILSPPFCEAPSGPAINTNPCFLPSFKGARPSHRAQARGVKIIDAPAHYVTSDLNEGPIIEQDVERVDHSMSAQQLTRVGS